VKKNPPSANPVKQLNSFLAKYDSEIRSLARRALVTRRKRLPNAIEMVYDNCHALVIGFLPNLRASDAVFSIVLYPRYVTLFFLQGAGLPDPHRRLEGRAKVVRRVRLQTAETLDDPEIVALMNTALDRARVPFDPKQRYQLVIKSVSAKQRPAARRISRMPSAPSGGFRSHHFIPVVHVHTEHAHGRRHNRRPGHQSQ
jgi:hypothetical protein